MNKFLTVLGFLICLVPVQILPQQQKKSKKTDFGKILKGIGYLGLAAGSGYLSLKSYQASKGECDSKFTKQLISVIHDLYKNFSEDKPKHRTLDPVINFFDNLFENASKFPDRVQEYVTIAKGLSLVTGCSSLTFGILGLKNLLQA